MSTDEQVQIAEIKRDLIPNLFKDTSLIGEYGSFSHEGKDFTKTPDFMEKSPVSALASKLSAIVQKLTDADPEVITKKPTWLEKITGKHVEVNIRYQAARQDLDDLLREAIEQAVNVKSSLTILDQMLKDYDAECRNVERHIHAGKQFLIENPEAGLPPKGSIEYENPRERFERKLTNLATLVASHEMWIAQMKLTRSQAVDMLDRFAETNTILVPVWRQHTLALINSKNINPQLIAEATQAHKKLLKSLSANAEN